MPGAGTARITKRAEPRSTQQLVLIAAGAIVLVVLSVVVTFWFVNRAPSPKPAPKLIVVKPVDTSGPSPVIVAPAIKPPVVAPEPAPTKPVTTAPVVEQTASASLPAATPPPATPASKPATSDKVADVPTSAPSSPPPQENNPATTPVAMAATVATPPSASPPAAPNAAAPAATDPRVHAFIDAVKVKGILPSGTDSRVLMKDQVYRVNDIVDRSLGVRLTKVEANALTFTDSNGAVYVKNF